MYRIGIDLGGTNIAAGIVNEEFKIIAKASVPTRAERPAEEIVADIAALCLPTAAAPEIAAQLHELGVRGVLNFTQYDVGLNYPEMDVENIHLNDSFMTLCYKLNRER